jgi:hypothetical protein
MRLALLQFFDMVRIPGGRMTGQDAHTDATESTFRAEEGWELHEVSPGRFSIKAPHMPVAYTIGACEFGFFPFVEPAPVVEAPKGKRR